jgi:hypothetical protein
MSLVGDVDHPLEPLPAQRLKQRLLEIEFDVTIRDVQIADARSVEEKEALAAVSS